MKAIVKEVRCFNPSTGLMFIPASSIWPYLLRKKEKFQSLDWVDVYSGIYRTVTLPSDVMFQSLDWVDVYSGTKSPTT